MRPDDYDGEDCPDAPHEALVYLRVAVHQVEKDGTLRPRPAHREEVLVLTLKAPSRAELLPIIQSHLERAKTCLTK